MPIGSTKPAITPGRKTWVVYRAVLPQMVQSPNAASQDFKAQQSLSDLASNAKGVVMLPHVGVQLAPKDYLSSTVLGEDDPLPGTVAPGYVQRNVNRSHPEIPGSGSGSSLAASSGPMYEREQSATDDLSDPKFRLGADETAFPGPGMAEDLVMDRVYQSSLLSLALTGSYVWIVELETHLRIGTVPMLRAYFVAIAGSTRDHVGMGQYCATCYSNGNVLLYERGYHPDNPETKTWVLRDKFFCSTGGREAGSRWSLRIQFTAKGFVVYWGGLANPLPTGAVLMPNYSVAKEQQGMPLLQMQGGHIYRAPVFQSRPATVNTVLRADVPRAFKSLIQVKRAGYEANGVLQGRQFIVPKPHWGNGLRIEAYGTMPPSTAIDIKLFTHDGYELAATASGVITDGVEDGVYAEYDLLRPTGSPNAGAEEEAFYIEYHLSGDTTVTPTLSETRRIRNGFTTTTYPPPIEVPLVTKPGAPVSIMTGGDDPTQDSASWSHIDLNGDLDPIEHIGIFGVRIETEWDPEQPENRAVLYSGICELKQRTLGPKRAKAGLGGNGEERPENRQRAKYYDFVAGPITMAGSAQRRVDFALAYGASGNKYAKATTVITQLLNWSGWPLSMIDIPEMDIEVFPCASLDDLTVSLDTDMPALAIEIARIYLGAALYFDSNASDNGAWKLLFPAHAPYANKCIFTGSSVEPLVEEDEEWEDVVTQRFFSLASYPAESGVPVVPYIDAQVQDRRPDANNILLIGGVDKETGRQLSQQYLNPKSYQIHPDQVVTEEDLQHPDWIGYCVPLVIRNSVLQTQQAVNFYLGRYEQLLAHGSKIFHLNAPLVLIPHEDDETRRRPLRFGDPVLVRFDGDEYQCIVRRVILNWRHDALQMAIYELETVRDA